MNDFVETLRATSLLVLGGVLHVRLCICHVSTNAMRLGNVETVRAPSHCERVIGRGGDGAETVHAPSLQMQCDWTLWRRCTQRLYK